MAKLKCTCGNFISTSSSFNESEGRLFSQKRSQDFLDTLAEEIDKLIHALQVDKVDDWIAQNLGATYPNSIEYGEMIRDIMHDTLLNDALDVLECDECGRLWIQIPRTDRYRGYAPEKEWNPEHKVLKDSDEVR